jgi:hypothetical protein
VVEPVKLKSAARHSLRNEGAVDSGWLPLGRR